MSVPENWKFGYLSDFFETSTGATPKKSQQDNYGSDVPFVKPPELLNSQIGSTVDNLSVKGAASSRTLPPGSILVSCIGNLGKVGINAEIVAFNQQINAIKPNSDFISKFMFYQVLSSNFKEQLEKLASGTTVPIVNKSKFNSISVVLPPLPEQKRIVGLLDTVFADLEQARAKTEQNLKNARELFDSYLQQVFSQKGEGWVDVPLGNICNFKHGFAFKSEFFVDKSNLILLTPGSFYEDGGYRDREEKTKYYEGSFPIEYLLSKGDLLVAMTEQAVGLLGSSALVPENNIFLHNQRLGLVKITPEFKNKVSLKFLFHLFNTKGFRANVQETASGLKVRHTSPKKMQVISVPLLTDIEAQEAIAQKLFETKDHVIELELIYKQKLNSIDELKKSILQKAFSGEFTSNINKGMNDEV